MTCRQHVLFRNLNVLQSKVTIYVRKTSAPHDPHQKGDEGRMKDELRMVKFSTITVRPYALLRGVHRADHPKHACQS